VVGFFWSSLYVCCSEFTVSAHSCCSQPYARCLSLGGPIRGAITTPTSLAAGSLPNRLQVGCDDLQGPHNHDTNISQSASHVAPACMDITLVRRSAAYQAFHQNSVCKVCFPTFCTNCLELATEIGHQLRLTANV